MFNYNLEYLRAFYYVAKLGGFSRASQVLYVSQPAVSASVSKLEKYFGAKLLERDGREVTLTAEGAVLYRHVESAFEGLISGEREIASARGRTAGTLRIAATETPLYNLVLPKIRPFYEKYPDVFVSISGGGSVADAFALLRAGQADLAFGVTPLGDTEGLEILECGAFEDIAAASDAFSGLRGRTIPTAELLSCPVVAPRSGTNARAHLDAWFASQGAAFEPTYSVHTTSAILVFALNHVGVGILPSCFAQGYLESGRLFALRLEHALPCRAMAAAWRRNVPLSTLASVFLDFLQVGASGG